MENTTFGINVYWTLQDHLHIRGEYQRNEMTSTHNSGSPPHTWRILINELGKIIVSRITSTYVENTTLLLDQLKSDEDHLHIRGEYYSETA